MADPAKPSLLQTLIADGENFADHELPSLADVARMFKPLVARLEAELPNLAAHELSTLLGSTAAPAAIEQAPAAAGATPAPQQVGTIVTDGVTTQAAPAVQVAADLTPQEQAAKLRAEADALDEAGAAPETPAQKLRREADEAEAAERQAEATAGTAAGASAGSVVSDSDVARSTQNSGQS